MHIHIIHPSFFGKLFGKVSRVEVSESELLIRSKSGSSTTLNFSLLSDFANYKVGLFGSSLIVTIAGEKHRIYLLNRDQLKRSIDLIDACAMSAILDSISSAQTLLEKRVLNEYLRDSEIEGLENSLEGILEHYRRSKHSWEEKVPANELALLGYWESLLPISSTKYALRSDFEAKQLLNRKKFFDSVEKNELTRQQRLAVIRNNDINLVLAAAGTGKTSVMVAKALDLIESKAVDNTNVLILAYNNSAAREIKERVAERGEVYGIGEGSGPDISTFHALGRRVLKECNVSTHLTDFSDDPLKLEMWVTKWLEEYIQLTPKGLEEFVKLSYQPINPFDFKSKEQYDAYVRDNEYRTLNGERVKGYQELLVANWMFLNGVEYEYEAPYITKRRVEIGFDYRPDFHIKNTDIYLEHFGIDRSGNTREDVDKEKYARDMKSKRKLHDEMNTRLIETFHYDWVEGNLESRLQSLMEECGVELNPKSPEEIFATLKEMGFVKICAKRYTKCLLAIRSERLDRESALERLAENGVAHASEYADLLDSLHLSYREELLRQDRIDFDDMIIRATDMIKSDSFKPRWKHILVDEFQDISMARMELIRALVSYGPNPVLTVVGDDWQSIYRFSGGKLELTTRFDDLVGKHDLTKLEKTFRYNNSIAETAGTFVMENPEQYEKNVETHTKVDSSQVYLLDSLVNGKNDIGVRALQVLKKIRENDPRGSVAILARYRYLLGQAKDTINSQSNYRDVKYWTFHGSKGLEADYCVLIGFFQGKTGFPNMNKEEAVVEALLPSQDSFPHSEERRLLYVALTRAKDKSYLIADPMASSEFINELLSPKYKLRIVSKMFEERYRKIFKCPLCSEGYFKLVSGKFGEFYRCTSGSVCDSKPRVCEKCKSPSIDEENRSLCKNPSCRHEKTICNRCGRPMRIREGRFGTFLGCSGYGIKDDQCKNTRNYF